MGICLSIMFDISKLFLPLTQNGLVPLQVPSERHTLMVDPASTVSNVLMHEKVTVVSIGISVIPRTFPPPLLVFNCCESEVAAGRWICIRPPRNGGRTEHLASKNKRCF